MFQQITSLENIEQAYLDIAKNFDEKGFSHRYQGIDGKELEDYSCESLELIKQIQSELINFSQLDPAVQIEILKKNGTGSRIIYVNTVKDRIKAQAIARIIEGVFEENCSDYIYSYRSSHPQYAAAKSVAKRYKKNYGEDYVFVSDISSYFESIDREILRDRLLKLGFSQEVMKLIDLFLEASIYSKGGIFTPKKGILTGVPLMVLFANWYLNDIDEYIGKNVSLYRRVGDDFIMFDKDREKIVAMKDYLNEKAKELGLNIKADKTKLIKSDQDFSLLGYTFSNNNIRIREATVKKTLLRWRNIFKYYPASIEKKLSRLSKLLYNDKDSVHNQFVQILALFRQATDDEQIKKLSESFHHILARYFFKNYSEKNHRKLNKLIKKIQIPSLYKYFVDFHNGRQTLASLALSKKKHY